MATKQASQSANETAATTSDSEKKVAKELAENRVAQADTAKASAGQTVAGKKEEQAKPAKTASQRSRTTAKTSAATKTKTTNTKAKSSSRRKATTAATSTAKADEKEQADSSKATKVTATKTSRTVKAKATTSSRTATKEKAASAVAASKKRSDEAARVTKKTVSAGEAATDDGSNTVASVPMPEPRRSVAFIGSECYPFVKTGGLGDVMYALPKALVKLNCDVKVILPKYACIKPEYQEKMIYRGSFDMDLTADGRRFYVGIMEYVWDGVVYDFIDNEEFFSSGNPYTNLVDDIPKFCYFDKAALAALNYMDWFPDVIHCHDWQAGLVPLFLRTMFANTPLSHAKVITTIHNLRFQGKYDIPTLKYWSNLPADTFNMGALQEDWTEANMLKGGLAYSDMITTVSDTYAGEIQTPQYGEGLDAHLRHHNHKLRGIVNGIDYGMWNPTTDSLLEAPYDISDVIAQKKANKLALQKELGLEQDEGKFVIGLISRLTNQKGLDLVNAIVPGLIDGFTQLVVLGTGDPHYENSFRDYENAYKGQVCSNIMYDEGRAHKIYAASDVLLVPSAFEPCGLTQLIAMHYGTIPVVRETGGLKDTVQPYNQFTDDGNGFTFDRYEAGLLYDTINRAKTLYFEHRESWDKMVIRNMEKDVSWESSAWKYRQLYLDLTM